MTTRSTMNQALILISIKLEFQVHGLQSTNALRTMVSSSNACITDLDPGGFPCEDIHRMIIAISLQKYSQDDVC